MEKRKTIWFHVPISTLIQAAESKSTVKIEFSYDELMEQLLDDNSSSSGLDIEKIFQDPFGSGGKQERLTAIKCYFGSNFLKKLVESKEGYTTSISWDDALMLALDKNYWSLNIPTNAESENDDEEEDETED